MSSRRDLLFENVCKELSNGCAIPLLYRITFEEALAITFQDFSHRQSLSDKGLQSNIKGRSRYFHKKANSVYLRILEYDPHIFIPFVLAFTPRACEKFDVSTFCQKHPKGSRLTTISKEDVVRIGNKLNIDEHPHFKILTSVLFTKVPPNEHKPATVAEGDAHWAYNAVHPRSIEATFGTHIGEVNDSSAPRRREKSTNQLLVTQTVRAKLPRTNFQDGIIEIDVGLADSFARTLFPHSPYLADLGSDYSTKNYENLEGDLGPDVLELSASATGSNKNDYIAFEGAAIWAIISVFPFHIFKAVESSQLRLWEKGHGLLDTTDCVTMKVSRKQPQQGTIRLRTGFIEGIKISNTLYAYSGEVH